VTQVALPLVLSSLSWTILTFIDRMFLMWWSRDAMAASFPAALLWWSLICGPLGICLYANTFVSQYSGARQPHHIGPVVWQAIWIGLLATPITMAPMLFADSIFTTIGHASAVRAQEVAYFRILCLSAGGMLISNAMSTFYSGRGKTHVVMLVDCGSVLLNIVLDYLWIFGHAGFPAAGIVGGGWATFVAITAKVVVYAVLLSRSHNINQYSAMQWRLRWKLCLRMLRFGGPAGLQMLLEISGFTVFVLLVGRLGERELTATNLAFNISSLAFMPVFGLSTAVSILVGQQLGRNQPTMAARATWTSVWLATSYMFVVSALYVLVPDLFLFGFFSGTDPSNHDIRASAVVLLRYVAAYNIFDALNLVFMNAIKGAGDTQFVFVISLAMAALLAASTWTALTVFNAGLHGCWCLITAWVWGLGMIYLGRFQVGKWRSMRVIELEPATATS
jgi:MATE family multidrug resistance protein